MKDLIFRPSSVIGLKETDAKRVIEMNYFGWIVAARDGVSTPIDRFFRDDRVKIEIEGDKIVDAYVG
jgi:hypothetical protein